MIDDEKTSESVSADDKRTCSFCGIVPTLRVTPSDPNDPIGICIECALNAVKILVGGAVDLLNTMRRQEAAKAAWGKSDTQPN
jgi:hypothetical protein